MDIKVPFYGTDIEAIERFRAAKDSKDYSPEGIKEFDDAAKFLAAITLGGYDFQVSQGNIKPD